jgi:hypothetical protein
MPPHGLPRTQPIESATRRETQANEPHCARLNPAPSLETVATKKETLVLIILLIILLLISVGSLPTWPYSRSWGYYPSGGLGLLLIIVLILLLIR